MNKKKLLFFTASFKKGGAERVMLHLMNYFYIQKHYEVYFVLMEDEIQYDLPSFINVYILSKRKKSKFQKLLEIPYTAWLISAYIKKKNIDTVLSFVYRPNYINIMSKWFGSSHKTIINIRSTTSRYKNEGLLGKVNLFLIKSLFNKADLIISNSYGVDQDLKSLMNVTTNSKVIYNPVDVQYINSQKEICEDISFDFCESKKYIISVGRLIPLKRNKDLINAFYDLHIKDDSLELIFLGDGVLKNDLIKKCNDLNIQEKVHFLGNVKNPFYYLSRSTLFVLNSEIEGFPNVLVEAMACGLPVISSDCKSGPREILGNEEYGLLYPVGDVETLIEKMKYYLYEDFDKDILESNMNKRLEDFNIDKIMKEFREVMDND